MLHVLRIIAYATGAAQVGVSNYNSEQVRRTKAVLESRGHKLASNQIEYSLLKRRPETSGKR